MATNYAYTLVPGKLKELLTKIREIGVPEKATQKWLESIGFKSTNDRSMLPVLVQVRLTDASGQPTEQWRQYRANPGSTLARCIKTGYSDLFNLYPNANQRSNQEIESFINSRSDAGREVILRMVSTFKALCEIADFSTVIDGPNLGESKENGIQEPPLQELHEINSRQKLSGFSPMVHIDVQIHISPDSTPEQIDQIFASMAKHLYKRSE